MSDNRFGKLFSVTTFGESHGVALGAIVDGCPPGLELTEADIQIDDTSVSRLHCAIVLGSEVIVRDLGSTNGTVVDGDRASESVLRDGSIIKIGNITLTYMSK